jgi:signal transduction histidine kinase
MMQVLLCLQSNALKFTKNGSVTIYVEILKIDLKKFLKISVVDTGIGIKQEDQSKLFKLFGFINNENKQLNKNGIGLGLMIAKQIVNQY